MSAHKPWREPESVPLRASELSKGHVLVLAGHTVEVEEVVPVGKRRVMVVPAYGRPIQYRVAEEVRVLPPEEVT